MNIFDLFSTKERRKVLFDNKTEITNENVRHFFSLALGRVEDFWKQILPESELP